MNPSLYFEYSIFLRGLLLNEGPVLIDISHYRENRGVTLESRDANPVSEAMRNVYITIRLGIKPFRGLIFYNCGTE